LTEPGMIKASKTGRCNRDYLDMNI
jgi:hypothetical protein